MAEHILFIDDSRPRTTTGTAGLRTQLPGMATTVSNAAGATGGIAPGNLIEPSTGKRTYTNKTE